MKEARAAIEVQAGLIPQQPEDEFTRRWFITSEQWHAEGADQAKLLTDTQGQAMAYAQYLMLQPDRLNWVRVDWVYF